MKLEELKMYLVRNSDGQYYRRVGYGGYGSCWTPDVANASVWTKLPPARSRITWMAVHHPQYPVPDLIVVEAGKIEVLNEVERIEKAKAKIKKSKDSRELRNKKWALKSAQDQLARAERERDQAQERINKLK
jgi:hypothetical protein